MIVLNDITQPIIKITKWKIFFSLNLKVLYNVNLTPKNTTITNDVSKTQVSLKNDSKESEQQDELKSDLVASKIVCFRTILIHKSHFYDICLLH